MTIYFYDGSLLTCYSIEISTDGKNLIADESRVIPLITVLRIVAGLEE